MESEFEAVIGDRGVVVEENESVFFCFQLKCQRLFAFCSSVCTFLEISSCVPVVASVSWQAGTFVCWLN